MADEEPVFCQDEEKILRVEAKEAIKDIQFAVKFVEISTKLDSSKETVYFNMTTKENHQYCVELSVQGFRVVCHKFDTVDDTSSQYFETIYSLLDHLSPGYRKTFGDALLEKLSNLERNEIENI